MTGSTSSATDIRSSRQAQQLTRPRPPESPSSSSNEAPSFSLRHPFARFSSPPRSGSSTPRMALRSASRSSSSIYKTGSPSTSASPVEGYLALHTTLSGTSTVREGRSSLEEDTTDPEIYSGGANLSRHATAPQPSTPSPLLEADEPMFSMSTAPARPELVRESSDDRPTTATLSARRERPRGYRQRASSTSLPHTRMLPVSKAPPLPPSRPQTASPTPSLSAPSLQSVLFNGLLNATLADLHLVAFDYYYRLHRLVVAGQSGFFRSLLAGGFSEERSNLIRRGSDCDVLNVELNSPMSRSAFEFCLARLYGGGPDLCLPPWAQTSQTHPLSVQFDRLSELARGVPSKGVENATTERSLAWDSLGRPDMQPAPPKYLISLLATSSYLEIPSVQALVLEMIQSSLTPWTIGRYLAFACGQDVAAGLPDAACRGLEGVGHPYDVEDTGQLTPITDHMSFTESANASYASSLADISSANHEHDDTLFVGPEGERIGEACATWLSKWGADILLVEEWLATRPSDTVDQLFYDPANVPAVIQDDPELRIPALRVWSSKNGGLPASWVRGIISSDAFFVHAAGTASTVSTDVDPDAAELGTDGEFQRYLFAKRVVQLRRTERLASVDTDRARTTAVVCDSAAGLVENFGGLDLVGHAASHPCTTGENLHVYAGTQGDEDATDDEEDKKCGAKRELLSTAEATDLNDPDEAEYAELFASGIHYSHMTFRQLLFISSDACTVTGRPFVKQSVIERAFWQSEAFKSQLPVTASSRLVSHAAYSSLLRTPGPDNMLDERPELGLTASVETSRDSIDESDARPYYLVPIDDTTRINERVAADGGELNEVPPARKASTLPRGPENFFGLALETRPGSVGSKPYVFGSEQEAALGRKWVAYEPCRVGVEFWGVQSLKDKQRLYSATFFYAGSFYNLYLQKIQKKGALQLGIYLHRQNPHEPFPVPSQPPDMSQVASDAFRPRHPASAITPYTDRRKQIRAFFSIWCPNQLGNSMTKFSSGPDSFALSQSWGWKSSSLSQEFLGAATLPESDQEFATSNASSSLRVTIVMGVV